MPPFSKRSLSVLAYAHAHSPFTTAELRAVMPALSAHQASRLLANLVLAGRIVKTGPATWRLTGEV
jgi:predicted HTH transcriptional regulator